MSRFLLVLSVCVLMAQALWADGQGVKSDADANNVKLVGKLRTGLIAIGGETTGFTIQSKGKTWELEFSQDSELKKTAETLDGKRVTVEGCLERREGVEVKERWVVCVTRLQSK